MQLQLETGTKASLLAIGTKFQRLAVWLLLRTANSVASYRLSGGEREKERNTTS